MLASGLSEAYQQATAEVLEQTPRLTEAPMVVEDMSADPRLGHRRDAHEREGIRSMLVLPLSVRGSGASP